jgi:hypothetical protein
MDQIAALSTELIEPRADIDASPAECVPGRLHGNSAPRRAAKTLRDALVAHCGGRPSATQEAMIDQAAELKLRLAVMDADYLRTSHRSAHASRDYLAWSNSLVRLLRQLGLQGAAERPPSLAEILARPVMRAATPATPRDAGNDNPPTAEPPSAAAGAAGAVAA